MPAPAGRWAVPAFWAGLTNRCAFSGASIPKAPGCVRDHGSPQLPNHRRQVVTLFPRSELLYRLHQRSQQLGRVRLLTTA